MVLSTDRLAPAQQGVARNPTAQPGPLDALPVLNAFWKQTDLTLVIADPKAKHGVRYQRQRAEHSCFIRTSDLEDPVKFHRMLNSHRAVRSAVFEDAGEWMRVCWRDRDTLKHYCKSLKEKGVRTYEGAVSPVLRHMVDMDLKPAPPRGLWIDIESDSRVPFSRKEEMRILCWAAGDADGNVWTGMLNEDTDDDERRLLIELWELVAWFDQVMAWSGDRFDFPVIKARSERYNLLRPSERDWRRWLWLDHLELFKRMNMSVSESGEEKQSYKLDTVAQSVLGVGKGKLDLDSSKTWEEWEAGGDRRQFLLDYCVQDMLLMPAIEAKTGYIQLLQTVSDTCGTFADSRGTNPGVQVEGFLARLGHERGHKFPTVLRVAENAGNKYEGAYVMHPQKEAGIHRDVHVADFAALYPSIIRTWNMSPETIITMDAAADIPVAHAPIVDRYFRTDVPGILPEAVKRLMALRAEWNKKKAALPPGTDAWKDADRRASAYKITTNSFYGVIGAPTSRFYDPLVAESVTQCGKWLILETIRAAEARGMNVIYGDTDSLFVVGATKGEFEAFVKWCNVSLYPDILPGLGCTENIISLAYEKQFDRLVFTAAKKYCNPPECPIWMADGSFKPLGEIQVGDMVMGWVAGEGGARRKLAPSEVVALHHKYDDIVQVTMESGRKFRCTPDHQWLRYRAFGLTRGTKRYSYPWATPKVGRDLVHVVVPPPRLPPDLALEAAWLGGIYDGEGSLSGADRNQIVLSQSPVQNPEVCERIERTLDALQLPYSVWKSANSDCNIYALRGSMQARLNFLVWCRPAKAERIAATLFKSSFATCDRIESVEPSGYGRVMGMTTTTGNYVAWGYASKNCGSYMHYKGTAANQDSHPEIKGFEFKRGDSLRMTRALQEELVNLLVGYKQPFSDDPDDYVVIIERWRDRILNDRLELKDVLTSKRLSREVGDYKVQNNPMVRIAMQLDERGQDVGEGAKIDYVVVDASVSPQAVIPAFDYDPDTTPLNREALWDKHVWPASERLMKAAFPGYVWNYGGLASARKRAVKDAAKAERVAAKEAERVAAKAEREALKAAKQAAKAPANRNPVVYDSAPPPPRRRSMQIPQPVLPPPRRSSRIQPRM